MNSNIHHTEFKRKTKHQQKRVQELSKTRAYEVSNTYKKHLAQENRKLNKRLTQLDQERFDRMEYLDDQMRKLRNELQFVIRPTSVPLARMRLPKVRLAERIYLGQQRSSQNGLVNLETSHELINKSIETETFSGFQMRMYNFIRRSTLNPGNMVDYFDDDAMKKLSK